MRLVQTFLEGRRIFRNYPYSPSTTEWIIASRRRRPRLLIPTGLDPPNSELGSRMGAAETRSRHYPVRVIYLGGLGRSGSTLLERLLGELPGVCACGEVVHLWQRGVTANERCGCGLEFSACDFWSQVGKQAFGGWDKLDIARTAHLKHAVDRIRMIPRLALRAGLTSRFRSDLAEYSQNYVRVYRAIADVSGCDAVVDSSKHASLAFCLSSCPDIDLRVIHVVRDSRAVAYSWTT